VFLFYPSQIATLRNSVTCTWRNAVQLEKRAGYSRFVSNH